MFTARTNTTDGLRHKNRLFVCLPLSIDVSDESSAQSFPVAKKAWVADMNLREAEVRVAPAVLRREATPPAMTGALSAGCEDAVLELREAQV